VEVQVPLVQVGKKSSKIVRELAVFRALPKHAEQPDHECNTLPTMSGSE